MKIITIVGARPQFIKAAAVSTQLKKHYPEIKELIIHTGQHYDVNMSDIFFDQLNISEPAYNLSIGSGSHAQQTSKILEKLEAILIEEKPNIVLLYGDTNSTLGAAICASKLCIPIVHVEGGVRNTSMEIPEQVNRVLTDHVSDLIFSPTEDGMDSLKKENLIDRAYNYGDVMLDILLLSIKKSRKESNISEIIALPNEYYLATIHRHSNTDDVNVIKEILNGFQSLDEKVVFLRHPRTKHKMQDYQLADESYDNIIFHEPISYLDMLYLVDNCKMVLTDSGGLQKEACFLEKPSVMIFDHTPWRDLENLGWIKVVKNIKAEEIVKATKNRTFKGNPIELYGNGQASYNIAKKIKEKYFTQ
ncbi:MAG: UDP-N-acetylglucosamine 2-epimerase (non-hydrolyzing) [Winogradskyella sp.]|nr:MAG: UDP-N-acetylglucosamine 2-epimerase (non-hydrolyzing) [Winogradskyella sp.]